MSFVSSLLAIISALWGWFFPFLGPPTSTLMFMVLFHSLTLTFLVRIVLKLREKLTEVTITLENHKRTNDRLNAQYILTKRLNSDIQAWNQNLLKDLERLNQNVPLDYEDCIRKAQENLRSEFFDAILAERQKLDQERNVGVADLDQVARAVADLQDRYSRGLAQLQLIFDTFGLENPNALSIHGSITKLRSNQEQIWKALDLLGIVPIGTDEVMSARIFAGKGDFDQLKASVNQTQKELGPLHELYELLEECDYKGEYNVASIVSWAAIETRIHSLAHDNITSLHHQSIESLTSRVDRLDVNLFGISYVQELAKETGITSQDVNLGDVIKNIDYRIRAREDTLAPDVVRPGKKKPDLKGLNSEIRELRDRVGFIFEDLRSAFSVFIPPTQVTTIAEAFRIFYQALVTNDSVRKEIKKMHSLRLGKMEILKKQTAKELAEFSQRLDKIDQGLFRGPLVDNLRLAGISVDEVTLGKMIQNLEWRISSNRKTFEAWMESQGYISGPQYLALQDLKSDLFDLRKEMTKKLTDVKSMSESKVQESIPDSTRPEPDSEKREDFKPPVTPPPGLTVEPPPGLTVDDSVLLAESANSEEKSDQSSEKGEPPLLATSNSESSQMDRQIEKIATTVDQIQTNFERLVWSMNKGDYNPEPHELLLLDLRARVNRLDQGLFEADGPLGYLPGLGTNLSSSLLNMVQRLDLLEGRIRHMERLSRAADEEEPIRDTGGGGIYAKLRQFQVRLQRVEGVIEIASNGKIDFRESSPSLTEREREAYFDHLRESIRLANQPGSEPLFEGRNLMRECLETGVSVPVLQRILFLEADHWALKSLFLEATGRFGHNRYMPREHCQTLAGLHKRVMELEQVQDVHADQIGVTLRRQARAEEVWEPTPTRFSPPPNPTIASQEFVDHAIKMNKMVDDELPILQVCMENEGRIALREAYGELAMRKAYSELVKKPLPLREGHPKGDQSFSSDQLKHVIQNSDFRVTPIVVVYYDKNQVACKKVVNLAHTAPFEVAGCSLSLTFAGGNWGDLVRRKFSTYQLLQGDQPPIPVYSIEKVSKLPHEEFFESPLPESGSEEIEEKDELGTTSSSIQQEIVLEQSDAPMVSVPKASKEDSSSPLTEETVLSDTTTEESKSVINLQPVEQEINLELSDIPQVSELKTEEENTPPPPTEETALSESSEVESKPIQPEVIEQEAITAPKPLLPIIECLCGLPLDSHLECYVRMTRLIVSKRRPMGVYYDPWDDVGMVPFADQLFVEYSPLRGGGWVETSPLETEWPRITRQIWLRTVFRAVITNEEQRSLPPLWRLWKLWRKTMLQWKPPSIDLDAPTTSDSAKLLKGSFKLRLVDFTGSKDRDLETDLNALKFAIVPPASAVPPHLHNLNPAARYRLQKKRPLPPWE